MIVHPKYSFRLISKNNILTKERGSKDLDLNLNTKKRVEDVEIDNKKRSFLKLLGVVTAGVIGTSILPTKTHALVFGSTPNTSSLGVKNSSNQKINPATEDTLAGIKSQTDLLTFDAGSNPANLKVNIASVASGGIDFGLQNASNVTINPATEDTLAAINSVTSQMQFTGGALLTSVGGTGNIVGIKDTTSTQVNPATDDSLVYLRRMVKLMESQAAVDSSNRQRVTVDSFGNIVTGVGASGTGVPRVTVANDSNFLATISTLNGYNDQMFQDVARNTYSSGIRANIVFA